MGGGPSVQLVLLGLDTTGKTTLLYRLKFGQYTNAVPTVGFNYEKIEAPSGKVKGLTFSIWDVGGKDNMRPLWKSYLRSAEGILFVVDSSDRERLEEARVELNKLVKTQNPQGRPTLILANKQDLPDAMEVAEVEKLLALHELTTSTQCRVLPTCAITGEGLDEAMDAMYEMIKKWKKAKAGKIHR